jgi:hypothetical protein
MIAATIAAYLLAQPVTVAAKPVYTQNGYVLIWMDNHGGLNPGAWYDTLEECQKAAQEQASTAARPPGCSKATLAIEEWPPDLARLSPWVKQ